MSFNKIKSLLMLIVEIIAICIGIYFIYEGRDIYFWLFICVSNVLLIIGTSIMLLDKDF